MNDEALLDSIATFANIPAESGNEKLIQPAIEREMKDHVDDMWKDSAGNMYFFRAGKRDGQVLLCAHQDKVVRGYQTIKLRGRNDIGFKVSGKDFKFKDLVGLLEVPSTTGHFWDGSKLIEAKLGLENREESLDLQRQVLKTAGQCRIEAEELGEEEHKKTPTYIALTKQIKEFSRSLKEGISFYPTNGAIIRPRQKLLQWSKFTVHDDGLVEGKLDDALGLGMFAYANKTLPKEESPDLLTVFTVEEEIGCRGAGKSAHEISGFDVLPSRVLVIDTTAFAKPGEGPTIYKRCGGVRFDERYIADLEAAAEGAGVRYSSVEPFTLNDSTVLAAGLDTIATAAVEVPITGMHSPLERTTKSDIVQTYQLLQHYLSHGNVSPLEGVTHKPQRRQERSSRLSFLDSGFVFGSDDDFEVIDQDEDH